MDRERRVLHAGGERRLAKTRVAALLAAIVVTAWPGAARADDLTIWTTRAIATVLAEVGPTFERTSGHRLKVTSDLPTAFGRWIAEGRPFDLLISGSAPVDEWLAAGHLQPGTRTDLARSGIGVEVKAGAPAPDIESVAAFTAALRRARSVAFLKVGSGLYLAGLFTRLGLADELAAKAVRPDTDIVSELVAKGEVELGLTVITQILTTPGVRLVGPLPPAVQSYVTFTAGVGSRARAPDAARALISFLQGPAAVAVMRAQGMEPVGR